MQNQLITIEKQKKKKNNSTIVVPVEDQIFRDNDRITYFSHKSAIKKRLRLPHTEYLGTLMSSIGVNINVWALIAKKILKTSLKSDMKANERETKQLFEPILLRSY
uniref:Uncharacterized protein n=1 Tax=Glossina austeni TaxID=7395 RepID=A0A1A9V8E3_GLOAU